MRKGRGIPYVEKDGIFIIHGTDYENVVKWILEQTGVAADIGDANKKVTLKPNLVTVKVPSSGATTYSELLAGVIECLQKYGFRNITIMEGPWAGDHTEDTFQAAGYYQVCSRYGVPLVDLQCDTWEEYDVGGMRIKLCDRATTVDYIINMPVLKRHCQTTATCAPKNSRGVIPNSEEHRFHTLGLHKPIVHLNIIVRNDFILMDDICGNLDFEEGGSPAVVSHVLGSRDPVPCDASVRDCMDYSVDGVPYIIMAQNLGVESTDTAHVNMIYLNRTTEAHNKFRMVRRVQHLAVYTASEDTYSACCGSLIYALNRLSGMGYLRKGLPPVCTGQGYKGQGGATGVGQCIFCLAKTLGGCPPRAADIMKFLGNQ